jgi:hypothetical protein
MHDTCANYRKNRTTYKYYFHLIVPNSIMESDSPIFLKKLGPTRIKYVINIKNSKKKKNQKLTILNNLLKEIFHPKN